MTGDGDRRPEPRREICAIPDHIRERLQALQADPA